MSTRPDLRRVKELFKQALDLNSEEERQRFLRQACGEDLSLAARVQELLQAFHQAEAILAGDPDAPGPESQRASGTALRPEGLMPQPEDVSDQTLLLPVTEKVGDQLGSYKLLQKIGEGGCGIVYMAEQLKPVHRRVALKVVKLGMDTKEVIARFEAERQALAVLDHPNIAKVFDAGATDTGRPYFVMELVRGVRITQFCDEQQMDMRERLGLFVQVCHAIQHAHQKGIIHRDIKPSNILVTLNDGVPVPKVIDFGIAKATQGILTDKTLFTLFEQFLGTPAYMSPEQAEVQGVDIDTRTDIYSLGVVLYELLTGGTPFDSKALLQRGIEELILTLRQVEPPRPSMHLSTLDPAELAAVARSQRCEVPKMLQLLRGDLDWIVMKCLEKDRTRRYETANELAMDINRHLAHEPVTARPPSAAYRFQRAMRRNKAVFAAGGVVLAGLVLGLGLATYGLFQATAERDRAEAARIEAQSQEKIADEQRQLANASAQAARQEQEISRRALARAEIALAEAAYREQDGVAMKLALEAVPADLRDTNWDYLMAHADTSTATFDRLFVGAAAHPTRPGVFAVAEGGKGSIALVQAKTGQELLRFQTTPRQRREFYYRGLSISPDGQRVAVGSLGQGGIAIYDLQDGSPLVEWEAPETDLLQFSADGKQLLQSSSINGQVCLWEAPTGRRLWTLNPSMRAVFGPDSQSVIATRGAELVVLDAVDGNVRRSLGPLRSAILALAIRPNGRLIVTGDFDGYLRGFDPEDGRMVFERSAHQNYIRFLEFTADGRRFATVAQREGQRQSIKVWDAETGTHLQSVLGGISKAESLRVHPLTDEVLVTGHISKIWALSGGKPKWTLPGGKTAAFFGGDNSCLGRTPGSGVGLFQWGADAPAVAWHLDQAAFWLVNTSADGRVAAATRSGNLISETHILHSVGGAAKESRAIETQYATSFVRLSPSGDRILMFVPEGICSGQFNTVTGESLPLLDHTQGILAFNDVVWLAGDRVVGAVTAYAPRGVPRSEEWLALWDAPSGKRLLTKPAAALVHRLASAPDGRSFAEAGDDKMVRIRDAATLAVQSQFRAHDASIRALAWHPTRPVLATASADLTIKLWDLAAGKCLQELRGPLKPVLTLHFSPSGQHLVSAGTDQTRVWQPQALQAASPEPQNR